MLPADVGFLEDILHVIFAEIVSLDGYGTVRLRVVVNIVVSAVSF